MFYQGTILSERIIAKCTHRAWLAKKSSSPKIPSGHRLTGNYPKRV